MTMDRESLLAVVNASPARVAAQDKQGWLELFGPGSVIEDPVGTAPRRDGELGRFWDVFIAANDIRFEVIEDIVAPPFVVRDVVIHTRLSSGGQIRVPAHLLYELAEGAGQLCIRRLAAHWELLPATRQALAGGLAGSRGLLAQSLRLLRILGPAALGDYTRALLAGLGKARGRELLARFAEAVRARDAVRLERLCGASGRIELPAGQPATAAQLIARLAPGALLLVSDVRCSGRAVSFRFRLTGPPASGIGLLELSPRQAKIARAVLFEAGDLRG